MDETERKVTESFAMTENRRILLNIAATYGRSLYALVCGLFAGRWVLMALGEQDYGLYGVVGGLTFFILFLVSTLSMAVGRFYAYAVGQARTAASSGEGVENCRKWFNTALFLHATLPLVLVAIGLPIVEYGLREGWLNIPVHRIEDCVWVFRCACLASLVGIVLVPFSAMYQAKQYIAELTIYGFATTTLNVLALYYMATHPAEWLVKYAAWTAFVQILPPVIIALRAFSLFPECRIRPGYFVDAGRIKAICQFAGWHFFGSLGSLFRTQGIAVVINRNFGAAVNAANALGTTVSQHCDTLSGSMVGAFFPAITNACGAGDWTRMRSLAYRCCKLGTVFTMIFALPLMQEMDEVLRLWLAHPPAYTARLCRFILVSVLIDRTAVGHMLAVNAAGQIAQYQATLGTMLMAALPLAVVFIALGFGVDAIGHALVLSMAGCAWGRVWFARRLVGLSALHWLTHILLPLILLAVATLGVGLVPRLWMEPSFARVCVTTALCEIVLFALAWFVVMDRDERRYVKQRLKSFTA